MAQRPEILEILQWGIESTFGTAVDADLRPQSISIDLDPKIPTEEDRSQGFKSSTGVVVMKEHCEASIKGNASFNDLAYLFSTLLCEPVITTPVGGTNARLFTFFPSDTDADTFNSLTIQKGSSVGASEVPGCRMDELELTFVPDKGVDMKGKLIGKAIEDGITMTASPTLIAKESISPRGISVYLATSEAGLAAGQINPLEGKWSMKNRHTPVFTLDASETSFDETVERGLMAAGQITVSQDSAANAYMTALRAGSKRFIKFVCRGSLIEGSLYNELRIIMPFNFREPKRNPKSDVHCGVYDLSSCYDETFGGSVKVEIQTTMTAL
jgi:hypothetical protein